MCSEILSRTKKYDRYIKSELFYHDKLLRAPGCEGLTFKNDSSYS